MKYVNQDLIAFLVAIRDTRLELRAAQLCINTAKQSAKGILELESLQFEALQIAQRLLNLQAALDESTIRHLIEALEQAA